MKGQTYRRVPTYPVSAWGPLVPKGDECAWLLQVPRKCIAEFSVNAQKTGTLQNVDWADVRSPCSLPARSRVSGRAVCSKAGQHPCFRGHHA